MLNNSFRGKIFFYYIVVFLLFTAAVIAFQYEREKRFRTHQLESTLENVAEITARFIEKYDLIQNNKLDSIRKLNDILPQPNLRITVISNNGTVMFDSSVEDYRKMENHLHRPEIQKAIESTTGANIRHSATTQEDYYYFAKKYKNYFIRTAVVYNLQIQNFLKTERYYLIFVILTFTIIGVILYFITSRMAVTITKLRDFAVKAGKNEPINPVATFPGNELGTIGSQIITIYSDLKKTKDELATEREKLLRHLNALNEGIAFFSAQRQKTLSNRYFILYLNYISDRKITTPEQVFEMEEFAELKHFLDTGFSLQHTENLQQHEFTISKGEKYLKVLSIIFPDQSFEVVITDITRLEKRRLMKQQLTSNISHELKTPLASIKGYLETMLENRPVSLEKQRYFMEKAYLQAQRLTDLINDVSLLTNIEDAGELFRFKPTGLKSLIDDVYQNFANRIDEKNILFTAEIPESTVINGNESLLFSVFQNLVENSINYGGKGISINIKTYHEDDKYYYFSYSDTGAGIPDEHLSRIFERFYRVDHGRTRETGGTGLGLAIVKNAIQLHKGEISVRNRETGGIEFLFTLAKR